MRWCGFPGINLSLSKGFCRLLLCEASAFTVKETKKLSCPLRVDAAGVRRAENQAERKRKHVWAIPVYRNMQVHLYRSFHAHPRTLKLQRLAGEGVRATSLRTCVHCISQEFSGNGREPYGVVGQGPPCIPWLFTSRDQTSRAVGIDPYPYNQIDSKGDQQQQ